MLKIAVVDDERAVCTQVERLLAELSKQHGVPVDIDVYYDGLKFCNELKNNYYDVIFLDIEIGEMSGIDVSRNIRNVMGNNAIQIVYISGKTEYAIELFDFDPTHFLIKPLTSEKIDKAFQKIITKLSLKAEAFTFKSGHNIYKIPLKDIIYFESAKRKINLCCVDAEYSFYGSLDDIAKQVEGQGFVQIHQSYLIHALHIKSGGYTELTMVNGTKLPISQAKRKQVREFLLSQITR